MAYYADKVKVVVGGKEVEPVPIKTNYWRKPSVLEKASLSDDGRKEGRKGKNRKGHQPW